MALVCGVFALSGCGDGADLHDRHGGEQDTPATALTASDNVSGAVNGFFDGDRGRHIAVAQFDDLSGVRVENGASTAVAASGRILTEYILMRANTDGAFRVLDRAGLNNLLNERRLVDEINSRNENEVLAAMPPGLDAQMAGRVPPLRDLAPLQPSDYLIYGAVVGYDRRLIDNGTGVGLAGYRATSRLSRDQVNVIVQLVEVATGRIIATGFAAQFIDSSSVGGGIFTLLSSDRLLEYEQANLVNEPTTLALFHAIDAALTEMFDNA